ncbi:MAG: HAMP domain-containing histidine kinase [Leptospiraceae bacterium]|nr:HAMP domain-containing histidine kinase [Leptospiraceae bacterium]
MEQPSIEITYDPTIKVRGITEELFKQQPEGKFVLKPFTIISKKVYKNFTDNGSSFRYLVKFLKKKYRKDNDTILKIFSLPARFQKLNLISSLIDYFLEQSGLLLLAKPLKLISHLKYFENVNFLIKKILTNEQKNKLNPIKYITAYLFFQFILIIFLVIVTNPKSSYIIFIEFQNTYPELHLNLSRFTWGMTGILVAIFVFFKKLPPSIGKLYKTYFITRNLFYTIEKAKAEKSKKNILIVSLDLFSYFDKKSADKIIGYLLYSSLNYNNIFIIFNSQSEKFIKVLKTGINENFKNKISFFIEDKNFNDQVELIQNDDFKENFLPFPYNDSEKRSEELKLKDKLLERKYNEYLASLIQSAKLDSMSIATSGLAHEIRNPLSIIQLIIENLRTGKILNQEVLIEKLNKIQTQVSRIFKLTETFQKFSSDRNLTKKSINRQLTDSLSFFEQRLLSNKIEVNYEKPEKSIGEIEFSEEFSIVIENLISNSIDALSESNDAIIKIRMALEGNKLLLVFSDNGHGISEEDRNKIFTPLFTTKGPGKGTGLGLWLCYTIVKENLKGDIRVDSELNQGTSFTISLPIGGDE